MSGKKILRRLVIGFGILMLFLAVDIAVAWYLNPKAETPVQAVRMEATRAAAKILATTMKAQIKKQEAAPVPPPPAAASEQPAPPQEQAQAEPEEQSSDKGTHLDDIEAEDNILVYTISVKANGAQFDYVMRTLHSNLFPSGCTKPEYERLLEYGLGVTLDFRSDDGTREDAITFTPESCGYERISQQPPQAPQPAQHQEPPPQPDQQQQAQPQQPQPTQPQQ